MHFPIFTRILFSHLFSEFEIVYNFESVFSNYLVKLLLSEKWVWNTSNHCFASTDELKWFFDLFASCSCQQIFLKMPLNFSAHVHLMETYFLLFYVSPSAYSHPKNEENVYYLENLFALFQPSVQLIIYLLVHLNQVKKSNEAITYFQDLLKIQFQNEMHNSIAIK